METQEKKTKIYWVPNKAYRLANWQKEVKSGGDMIQPEASLVIYGVLQTSDRKKIKFIEASPGFKSGEIELVESLAHAEAKTHEFNRKRMEARVTDKDEVDQGIQDPTTITAFAGEGVG